MVQRDELTAYTSPARTIQHIRGALAIAAFVSAERCPRRLQAFHKPFDCPVVNTFRLARLDSEFSPAKICARRLQCVRMKHGRIFRAPISVRRIECHDVEELLWLVAHCDTVVQFFR